MSTDPTHSGAIGVKSVWHSYLHPKITVWETLEACYLESTLSNLFFNFNTITIHFCHVPCSYLSLGSLIAILCTLTEITTRINHLQKMTILSLKKVQWKTCFKILTLFKRFFEILLITKIWFGENWDNYQII